MVRRQQKEKKTIKNLYSNIKPQREENNFWEIRVWKNFWVWAVYMKQANHLATERWVYRLLWSACQGNTWVTHARCLWQLHMCHCAIQAEHDRRVSNHIWIWQMTAEFTCFTLRWYILDLYMQTCNRSMFGTIQCGDKWMQFGQRASK